MDTISVQFMRHKTAATTAAADNETMIVSCLRRNLNVQIRLPAYAMATPLPLSPYLSPLCLEAVFHLKQRVGNSRNYPQIHMFIHTRLTVEVKLDNLTMPNESGLHLRTSIFSSV